MDGVGLDVHVKLDRNCHLDERNMEEKRWRVLDLANVWRDHNPQKVYTNALWMRF